MLHLITGGTGASKTLNAIKLACEDETFKDRQVFYYGIPECTVQGWKEITLEELHKWHEYPKGSVFIIDEAQEVFPLAPSGAHVPDYIMKLFRNRRLGIDIILITIDPTLLHAHVRKAVKFHHHIERPFNSDKATWYSYQKCETNPLHFGTLKQADTRRVKLDKKYFGLYKSAEQHTDKRVIPKYYYTIAIGAVFILLGFLWTSKNFKEQMTPQEQPKTAQSQAPKSQTRSKFGLNNNRRSNEPETVEQYITKGIPRIPDIPKSAPMFDEVTKVKDYPREQCLMSQDQTRCTCYTQQATKTDVSVETCKHYVKNGFPFDPYKEPKRNNEIFGGGGRVSAISHDTTAPTRPIRGAITNKYAQIRVPKREQPYRRPRASDTDFVRIN